jgi:hypothetical protein
VAGERRGQPLGEEELRVEERRVGVDVAGAAGHDPAPADGSDRRGRRLVHRPAREPVHAAHVAAEQAHHEADLVPLGGPEGRFEPDERVV